MNPSLQGFEQPHTVESPNNYGQLDQAPEQILRGEPAPTLTVSEPKSILPTVAPQTQPTPVEQPVVARKPAYEFKYRVPRLQEPAYADRIDPKLIGNTSRSSAWSALLIAMTAKPR